MVILHRLAELHVQIRESRIHAVETTVLAIVHVGIGQRILVRQLVHRAECQERAETKRRRTAALQKRVANKHARLETNQHALLLKNHRSNAISRAGDDVAVKLTDVLVSVRTEMILTVLVQTQVELCTVLDYRLV